MCLPNSVQLMRNLLHNNLFLFLHFFLLSLEFLGTVCLIAASADCPALVVARVCLIFNCFAAFPLVALRIPGFPNWFLSVSSSNWRAICRLWLSASCFCPSVVAAVASLSTSSYSSILQLLCACVILEMTSRLFKNDIEHNFTVRYLLGSSLMMENHINLSTQDA